jgi:Response regulator containing a CheY-like receiver domain and an HTH DNA-binding domain
MTDRRLGPPSRNVARELADLCAQIRAAHPEIAWKQPHVPDTAHIDAPLHDHLPNVLSLYEVGLPYRDIAQRLGIARSTVNGIIMSARRSGVWPADLRRKRTQEAGDATG